MQDALITVLSEKTLPVPELGTEVQAAKGFNVIATANDRDRGVNDLSSALRRRFNTVVLPLPATERGGGRHRRPPGRRPGPARWSCRRCPPALEEIRRVVTVFRELRSGVTADGRTKLKSPSGTLSHGRGDLGGHQRARAGRALRRRRAARRPTWPPASSARSSRTRSPTRVVWTEYLEAVVRERAGLGATSTAPAAR